MCVIVQTLELTVSRGSNSQLGFNISRDAVVTDVEPRSAADVAGLKPFSRLVRICGSDVVAMSYEQVLDLLRSTSSSVVLTVVPPYDDIKNRRFFHVCPFIFVFGLVSCQCFGALSWAPLGRAPRIYLTECLKLREMLGNHWNSVVYPPRKIS